MYASCSWNSKFEPKFHKFLFLKFVDFLKLQKNYPNMHTNAHNINEQEPKEISNKINKVP